LKKKKKNPWYSFRLIIPALIIIPPLGLVLLWKSPHTQRVKAAVSILFLVLVTAAFVGAVQTRLYARYVEHTRPRTIDVRMDSRSNYVSPEILPDEREIFAAIVRQMRISQEQAAVDIHTEIVDIDSISPGTKAFRAVADEYNLDYEDVRKIYRKVSSLLSKKAK